MEIYKIIARHFMLNSKRIWDFILYLKMFVQKKKYIFLFSISTLLLFKYIKDKKIDLHYKKTDNNQKIANALKSKINSYSPTFWLPHSMLKTIYLGNNTFKSFNMYTRHELELHDGEFIALDLFPKNFESLSPNTPILVIKPGIVGQSKDQYIMRLCKLIHESLGWRVAIYNRRGYANMPLRGTKIFSFSGFEDFHRAFELFEKKYPKADQYTLGISLGGMFVQKYLAVYKDCTLIKAAVTISSAWDAEKSSRKLYNNKLFRKYIVIEFIERLITSHSHEKNFHKILNDKGFLYNDLLEVKSNLHFDTLTAIDSGLQTAEQLYEQVSSHNVVHDIEVPLMSINSMDDTIVDSGCIPLKEINENENIIQVNVGGAGHIAYFSGIKANLWAFELAAEYFKVLKSLKTQI